MNTRTGDIYKNLPKEEQERIIAEMQKYQNQFLADMIPVKEEEITPKQNETLTVSKYDNRSKLGKKFTESRQVRRRKQ